MTKMNVMTATGVELSGYDPDFDIFADPEDAKWEPAAFFGLSGADIKGMTASQVNGLLTAGQGLIARAQAIQAHATRRLSDLRGDSEFVKDEVALALSSSKGMGQPQVWRADELTTRLPETLAAMERGELDAYKADRIALATIGLDDEHARKVDAHVAPSAKGKDPVSIQRKARRAALKLDPCGGTERAMAKRSDRCVKHGDDLDGMSQLWAYLPAETVSSIYGRIDAIARNINTCDEKRTMDQIRADVFSDLLLGKVEGNTRQVHVQVQVTVPVTTLTGADELPGDLAGYGPIPAGIARKIAHYPHSTWRRLITDPATGQLLDVGRTRYRPPAALNEYVRARDKECRMPGWTFRHLPDGTYQVTTPTGTVHITEPEPIAEPEPQLAKPTEPPPF
ncbi:MAG: DUF222 domain-containing protein [Pseudonocardiaceae bacterium]|nr:DUF222 domain-containing protein [Pseudonocardiaceae bacterium]